MARAMSKTQARRAKEQIAAEERRKARELGLVDASIDTGTLATMVKGANPVMVAAFREAGARVEVQT